MVLRLEAFRKKFVVNGVLMRVTITDFYKSDKSESYPGILHFDGERLRLAYDDDEETVSFEGEKTVTGSWLLTCAKFGGRASLHRSPMDRKLYEGSFMIEGEEGMWQVVIDDTLAGE
jgi:hypothetical protein